MIANKSVHLRYGGHLYLVIAIIYIILAFGPQPDLTLDNNRRLAAKCVHLSYDVEDLLRQTLVLQI
jgi:hypothetical protein